MAFFWAWVARDRAAQRRIAQLAALSMQGLDLGAYNTTQGSTTVCTYVHV